LIGRVVHGRIDCHTLCIVGVALGNGGAFVLGMSDAVVEEQMMDNFPGWSSFGQYKGLQ
jgi:hypothetical protein